MFFQYQNGALTQIEPKAIDCNLITAGYVSVDELCALQNIFEFDDRTITSCRNASTCFRSGVEVFGDYTFTQLRIMNIHEEADDFIALYLRHNFILVVDICDEDGSTREKYLSAIKRYPPEKSSCEKILAAFLDSLLTGDHLVLESIEDTLSNEEEALILEKGIDQDFNIRLLQTKKQLSTRHTYYAQLMDIADAVCENDNDIFEDAHLIFVDNVSKKIARLEEETAALKNTVEHLQDAYSSYLDIKMNNTMKTFTVLTSIFFPLTIIVGWYGMNFQSMPELTWPHGYLYVILLSISVLLVFFIIGKKKKWF